MHIGVSWDIAAEGHVRWETINAEMRGVLQPYSWVQTMRSYFVVRIASEIDRQSIYKGLSAVSTSVPENVQFLITPGMYGGQYAGFVDASLWPAINARTGP